MWGVDWCFSDGNISPVERILMNQFPDSEICIITLLSYTSLWGYVIAKNGQRIRARAGCHNEGTFLELGTPLEQEETLLSKSVIDEDGNRVYLFDDFPEEPFSECAVGEDFVFEITSRYFGFRLDDSDAEELDKTMFAAYKPEPEPWWKFFVGEDEPVRASGCYLMIF